MTITDQQAKMALVAGLLCLGALLFLATALELVKDARTIEANAEHTVYLPPETIRELLREAQDIARQAALEVRDDT